MTRFAILLVALTAAVPTVAFAKCSDEIKALQGKAAGTDAQTKPGNQTNSTSPGTVPAEGGGQPSASAKILEAQAHDQKGNEAACMNAVEEAKKMTK